MKETIQNKINFPNFSATPVEDGDLRWGNYEIWHAWEDGAKTYGSGGIAYDDGRGREWSGSFTFLRDTGHASESNHEDTTLTPLELRVVDQILKAYGRAKLL